MRIIKCDKCGKEMDIPDYSREYTIYHNDDNSYDDGRIYVDLCENCYGEVQLLLNTDAHIKVAPIDDNPVPDEPMTVRQILEQFESWYTNIGDRAVRDDKLCIFHKNELYTPYSAIDEYLKEEGIEE